MNNNHTFQTLTTWCCLALLLTIQAGLATEASTGTAGKVTRFANIADLAGFETGAYRSPVFYFTPDGKRLVCGDSLFSVEPWKELLQEPPPALGESLWSMFGPLSPDSKRMVVRTIMGKEPRIGFRDVETLRLDPGFSLGKVWAGPFAFSSDGKGLYMISNEYLLRPRQPPAADYPVTEDINTRLRVSKQYDETIAWSRETKAYPEAESAELRTFFLYMDIKTKELRRIFTGNDVHGSGALSFSPDGRKLLAVQVVNAKTTRTNNTSADIYIIPIPPVAGMPLIDIEKARAEEANCGWFDAHAGRLFPVVKDAGVDPGGSGNARDPVVQWSPDSTKLAYAETGANRAGDVWVFDLSTHKASNLTATVKLQQLPARMNEPLASFHQKYNSSRFGSREALRWLPDSKALLVTAKGYLWRVPVDGSGVENLSSSAGEAGIVEIVASHTDLNVPYQLRPDEIIVRTTDKGTLRDGFAHFNLKTRVLTPFIQGNGLVLKAQVDPVTKRLFYFEIIPANGGELYMHDLQADSKPRQLTDFAQAFAGLKIPEKMLLSYTTKGGRQGWARLHLPADANSKQKLPLIISPEPPQFFGTSDRNGFSGVSMISALDRWRIWGVQTWNSEAELFNRAGYAVLYIDVPLSTIGQFEDLRRPIADAFEAAADAAVATGRVDPSKIGLFGREYGSITINGFMVQTAITMSKRYAAAVSVNGFGLLASQALSATGFRGLLSGIEYHAAEDIRTQEGRMQVDYVNAPARYEDNSAVPHFGQVGTPLLLLQNDNNAYVQPGRADESFAALLPTGNKVVAAFYNKGTSMNSEMYRRAIIWFDEHMKSGPVISGHAKLPDARAASHSEAESGQLNLPDGISSNGGK